MSVFSKIKTGLEEAIAYESGKFNAKTTKVSVRPIIHHDAEKVRAVRKQSGLTQKLFTGFRRER